MQNLSYPDDVEGDNNRAQGHYIMFLINETEAGKVATGRGHASDAAASAAAGRATAATRRAAAPRLRGRREPGRRRLYGGCSGPR